MKTILTKPLSLALLLTVAFILAACGSAGGGQQDGESAGDGEQGTDKKTGGMAGMDHSNMDHGSMGMGSGGMARDMVMENGRYSASGSSTRWSRTTRGPSRWHR